MAVIVKKKKSTATQAPTRRVSSSGVPSPAVIRRAFKTGAAGVLIEKKKESELRKRLAELISANIGKSRPLSMEAMMLKAGYSASTARARHAEIMGAARDEPVVQDHLTRLKGIRDKMVKRMEDTVGAATFGAIGFNLSVVEKSIALMEGKPTERHEYVLDEEERTMLDTILQDNE